MQEKERQKQSLERKKR